MTDTSPAGLSHVEMPPAKARSALTSLFHVYGKSLTWRMVASTDTFLLTLLATHNSVAAVKVVAAESLTKTFAVYPLHEYLWKQIPSHSKDETCSHRRALAKAVTWRFMGSADTLLVAWLATGKLNTASFVASAELLTKVGLYFGHEKFWHPGKKIKPAVCTAGG